MVNHMHLAWLMSSENSVTLAHVKMAVPVLRNRKQPGRRTTPTGKALAPALDGYIEAVRKKSPDEEKTALLAFETLKEKAVRKTGIFDQGVFAQHLQAVMLASKHPPAPLTYAAEVTPSPEELSRNAPPRLTAQRLSNNDIRRISKRAATLRQDILTLRRTPLVVYSAMKGRIPSGDLLRHDQSLKMFYTLLDLPALLAKFNKARAPTMDDRLLALCEYVKATTGSWNDALIVDILHPLGIPHTESADSLKMWRIRAVGPASAKASTNRKMTSNPWRNL